MERFKLPKKYLPLFNKQLRDLQLIKQDLLKAHEAGIPKMEELIEQCDERCKKIEKLKATYFSNEI